MFDQITEHVQPLIGSFAGKNGVVLQIISFIGTARIVFKPIMEGLSRAVKETEGKKDDVVLAKVESGKPFKIFSFFLDFFGSVKVPVVKTAAVAAQNAVLPAATEDKTEVK